MKWQWLELKTRWFGAISGLNRVSSIIYPPRCLLCGAAGYDGRDLCRGCANDLPWNTNACRQCALPLAAQADGEICGQCLADPPAFEHSLAALRYAAVPGWLIAGLKFRDQLNHARLLGDLLAERLQASGLAVPQRMIPVPLHPDRQRERGYNQALEIARPVARRLGLRLDLTTVRRLRHTQAQSDLKLKARRRNIRGAFAVRRPLNGEAVAILDDVVTSTATVRELATALRRAGAGEITVCSVARAPLPGQA